MAASPVIPATATPIVIPAKAGIQAPAQGPTGWGLDSRLRGNDG